ncbi:MAG: hypothetical protein ABL957_04640 [Parvularculaceae bacterium]
MKVKVSLSLSEQLLEALDKMGGASVPRSAFIERILQKFVDEREEARRNAKEVATINRHAAKLNAEMKDVLSYQADLVE